MTGAGVLRQLLASGPGRVGLILAAILALGSIYVVLTYPFDYGPTRWSNPTVWADNPHAAPPAWTNLFGPRKAVHRVLTASAPSAVTHGRAGPDPDVRAAVQLRRGRAAELPVVRPGTRSPTTAGRPR